MIYTFTCSTKDCENEKNQVFLQDPINPVLCSVCHVKTDAVAPKPEPKTITEK
jgi:hypothetical protein